MQVPCQGTYSHNIFSYNRKQLFWDFIIRSEAQRIYEDCSSYSLCLCVVFIFLDQTINAEARKGLDLV